MEAGKGPLASALTPTDGPFDLLVCNPPFFGSVEEQRRCGKASADEQLDVTADVAAAGGAVPNPHEAVCCGGEEQFLITLLTDSLALGADRVRWCVRRLERHPPSRAPFGWVQW
jgi:23S rRNA A1618 N6-methylase RlmF